MPGMKIENLEIKSIQINGGRSIQVSTNHRIQAQVLHPGTCIYIHIIAEIEKTYGFNIKEYHFS